MTAGAVKHVVHSVMICSHSCSVKMGVLYLASVSRNQGPPRSEIFREILRRILTFPISRPTAMELWFSQICYKYSFVAVTGRKLTNIQNVTYYFIFNQK